MIQDHPVQRRPKHVFSFRTFCRQPAGTDGVHEVATFFTFICHLSEDIDLEAGNLKKKYFL